MTGSSLRVTFANMITHSYLREILDYDCETGLWSWRHPRGKHKAGGRAGSYGHEGYVKITIDGVSYRSSRLAWFYFFGKWPENQIDHINRVRDDDRIENLRDVTAKENCLNKEKRSYPLPLGPCEHTCAHYTGDGVYYRKDRNQWRARTYVNRVRVHIGNFQTFEEATSAYNRFVGRS